MSDKNYFNTAAAVTQYPTAYAIHQSIHPQTAGYVRCKVAYRNHADKTDKADEQGLLRVSTSGQIEVVSHRYQFIPTGQRFNKKSVVLSGYEKVRTGTDTAGNIVWGQLFAQVEVDRRAWATASLFAADVLDGRAWCGVKPTPTPPMPPIVDMESDIPFSMVVA